MLNIDDCIPILYHADEMNSTPTATFPFHPLGYLRHWLVAGPHEVPYAGPIKNDEALRRDGLDPQRVNPPTEARLGAKGPFGQPWRFHYPGQNIFIEHSSFYASPSVIDSYAFTALEATEDVDVAARLWVAGGVDLWVNDMHVTRHDVPRYMHPDFQAMTLPLKKGVNRLCVRLQCVGLRDSRILFGLQLLDPTGLSVRLPDGAPFIGPARWLDGVQTEGRDALVSATPAPAQAEVVFSGASHPWPAGTGRLSLGEARPFQLTVGATVEGQKLQRQLEIPANRVGLPQGMPADIRQAHLDYIAGAMDKGLPPNGGIHLHIPLLARRVLGRMSELDGPVFSVLIKFINERNDCADFALAALLRMELLGLATPAESAEIKRTALAFRYWDDEPGHDVMCFWSENHSLLFHGCQFIAGHLYPDAVFSNSKRTGVEQAALGLRRVRSWLDKIDPAGFAEFLSGTYMPLTIGAILNVVDFSGGSAALIDHIYDDLADHAFRGIVVAPQGRVYRNVLYPEESGTQALLSYATPEAIPDFSVRGPKPKEGTGDWAIFLATSKIYQPPKNLAGRMSQPVSRRYTQAEAEIVLHKTADYILTSLAVPASGIDAGLRPGGAGYQQHLWQATLGPGCHVFVNHPGGSFDNDKTSRPAYWYGNGILPLVRQRDDVLQTIFNIADGTDALEGAQVAEGNPSRHSPRTFRLHPIAFTHAHWPSDAFDLQEFRGNWVFGQKNTGCIGLWCSEKFEPHDDVLTGRELRAPGYRSAWAVVCGGLTESGSFEAFIESCLARTPEFDRAKLALQMKGEAPLCWPDGK
jgi:hypothetical protein